MKQTKNKLLAPSTPVDLEYLICIAGGLIEELRDPCIYKNPENIRRLLNRRGVSEIVNFSRIFNGMPSSY